MCKCLSSNVIIGNFMLESLQINKFQIDFKELYNFDKQLSTKLLEYNYYSRFCINDVISFCNQYPFFVDSLDNSNIYINNHYEVYPLLIRYFRLGMPKRIVDSIRIVFKDYESSKQIFSPNRDM